VEKASNSTLCRGSPFFFIDVIMYIFAWVLSHRITHLSTGSNHGEGLPDGEGSLNPMYVTTAYPGTRGKDPRSSPPPAPASALKHFPVASRPHTSPSTYCILYGCISIPLQMTTGPMRRFSSSARTQLSPTARSLTAPRLLGLRQYQRNITDIRPRQASVSRSWFTSSPPCLSPEQDEQEKKRLAERNLKLGNSMRHRSLL
jgi:hypothetical protein